MLAGNIKRCVHRAGIRKALALTNAISVSWIVQITAGEAAMASSFNLQQISMMLRFACKLSAKRIAFCTDHRILRTDHHHKRSVAVRPLLGDSTPCGHQGGAHHDGGLYPRIVELQSRRCGPSTEGHACQGASVHVHTTGEAAVLSIRELCHGVQQKQDIKGSVCFHLGPLTAGTARLNDTSTHLGVSRTSRVVTGCDYEPLRCQELGEEDVARAVGA
mmetsp:Transcript_39857/g.74332  ORF Transcript_39857/g.74332 Transcript_39857/m.74332 type:complete len:218 (-) Transcript_39857:155-808(-)